MAEQFVTIIVLTSLSMIFSLIFLVLAVTFRWYEKPNWDDLYTWSAPMQTLVMIITTLYFFYDLSVGASERNFGVEYIGLLSWYSILYFVVQRFILKQILKR